MTCDIAHKEILTADPDELRGIGTSALASHIVECASCRAAATAILAGTGAIGPLLDARRRRGRSRIARRVAWVSTIPVAAAATWLIVGHQSSLTTPDLAAHLDRPLAARQVSVDVARGQRALVIKTADPHVTVVWFSPGVSQ